MNINIMLIIIVLMLANIQTISIKSLSNQCLCDISDACDNNCCCDKECSTTARQIWNKYDNCHNPGLPIPMCAQYQNQPFSNTDLYHGLSLIYTILRRLFCITRINFADQTKSVTSKTTDSQLQISSVSINQLNPNIASLASVSNFPSLPKKNSIGSCSSQSLKDMNYVIGQKCRVFVNSLADYATTNFLSVSAFITSNSFLNSSKLKVYTMQSSSAPLQTSVLASTITSSCSTSPCPVIKQIQFFFIKISGQVTLDYDSSYIVTGTAAINGPSFISIMYSYQFKPSALVFPSTSNQGYTIGSYLNFLQSSKTNNQTLYYKMMNPVNLAFVTTTGECYNSSNTSQKVDQSNLISFRLGVNTVISCLGSKSQFTSNLIKALKYVGFYGSSSNILKDYAQINFASDLSIGNSSSGDIKLVFYYTAIGAENNPQYRIISSAARAANDYSNNIQTLYIEYMKINSTVKLNVPNPPTIDAYLPDDFLYPFYVAG